MDIRLTFHTPLPDTNPPITELDLTVDRLTLTGPTLQAFRKDHPVAEIPLLSLSTITFPPRPRSSEKTPNAYRRWTPEADTDLLTLVRAGTDLPTLTTHFGRGRNGILTRLLKLGALTLPTETHPDPN
ncbi:hypothetical protein, partial [Actinocorallia lasiicapitis]